jgi:hypothetical protein
MIMQKQQHIYNEVHWRSGVRSGSGGGVSSVSDRLACHRLYINTIMTQILQLTFDTRLGGGNGYKRDRSNHHVAAAFLQRIGEVGEAGGFPIRDPYPQSPRTTSAINHVF